VQAVHDGLNPERVPAEPEGMGGGMGSAGGFHRAQRLAIAAGVAALGLATGCTGATAPRALSLPGRPAPPPLPIAASEGVDEAPAVSAPRGGYEFFRRPGLRDPWSLRIRRWQLRQKAAEEAGLVPSAPSPASVASSPDGPPARTRAAADGTRSSLAASYDAFLSGRRRQIAHEVLDWVQEVSERRFVHDGPVDHWPTLPEVLASEGDDCDGLELLAFHALRQLGFHPERVYRAVLHRPRRNQHHMVTLWFEDPGDPWVLDPTATITTRLQRLSELQGWIPLKVFSEDREYTVVGR
jgi:predicted transglutaminase-like cysteine proteinase